MCMCIYVFVCERECVCVCPCVFACVCVYVRMCSHVSVSGPVCSRVSVFANFVPFHRHDFEVFSYFTKPVHQLCIVSQLVQRFTAITSLSARGRHLFLAYPPGAPLDL